MLHVRGVYKISQADSYKVGLIDVQTYRFKQLRALTTSGASSVRDNPRLTLGCYYNSLSKNKLLK